MIYRLVAAVVLLALAPLGTAATTPATSTTSAEITILHTNDTHGHILPFSYPEVFNPGTSLARIPYYRNIGGIARRAGLAKLVRKEPNRSVVMIDAGDICDGSPFSTEYHGDADTAAMNAAGYDLRCPGNHEFNNTLTQLRKLVSSSTAPILCANATAPGGKPLFRPWILRKLGSIRVAFLGLVTESASTYPAAARDGVVVAPVITTAARLVPELRKQADLVIAITHIGIEEDRALAQKVPGIDVVIGGHSHTWMSQPELIRPVDASSIPPIGGVIVAHDFQWGGTLGRLDLALRRSADGRWTIRSYHGRPLPITENTPIDAKTDAAVQRYWHPIAARYGAVLGRATDDFGHKGSDMAEYNLMADAMRETTGAQFHMENIGGVRSPIAAGPITYADMVTIDPFSNTLVRFHMRGSDIRAVLTEHRPAVSGLRYTMDSGKLIDASIGEQPIQDDAIYEGSTNSFFANNIVSRMIDHQDTGERRLSALMAFVRRHKKITPSYDGRRNLRGMPSEDE